jgi:ferritin-like metal-binding protein YciE
MKAKQMQELLLQALEHELGGVQVYTTALKCVTNPELKKEWQRYLAETKKHVAVLEKLCGELGVKADKETPGRAVVRHLGESLVEAMSMALQAGDPTAAELVACECVVLAETKDHLNWTLLGKCAQQLEGEEAESVAAAYAEIEDQEDEHLYHSRGWCRELWIQSLGIPAVVPPPEETRKVKTAIGAAKAEQAAEKARL